MVHNHDHQAHHPTLLRIIKLWLNLTLLSTLTISITAIKAQDITGLEIIRTITHQNDHISAIDCYFMDGRQLIAYGNSSGGDGGDTLVIYDFETDEIITEIPGSWFTYTAKFVNADQLLYSNNDTLFRVVDFEFPSVTSIREDQVTTFALSPDRSTIAILGFTGSAWYVEIANYGQSSGALTTVDNYPIPDPLDNQGTILTFSPDGNMLAVNGGYEKNYIYFINLASGEVTVVNTPDNQGTYSPAFYIQNNKLRLAVGGGYSNGGIEVIDLDVMDVVASVPAFPHYNYALAFDPSHLFNVCGGYDGILKLFKVEGAGFTDIKSYEPGALTTLTFTQDNQYVISGHDYGSDAFLHVHHILREPSAANTTTTGLRSIYPNPTTGKLYFPEINDAIISVYDANGRIVLKMNSNGISLDVSILDPGFYILKASIPREIYIGKFIKS